MIVLVLFELFAVALFMSCVCRASYTNKRNTKRDVRWAFTFLGVVAVLCMVAPVFGYEPDGLVTALLAAIALLQVVTAHHWRAGVPPRFQQESKS